MTPDTPEPRFERFLVHYPGVVTESSWCIEGGGTVQQVRLEHPMAQVEAVPESLVSPEADRT
jgi:hypothetical protein